MKFILGFVLVICITFQTAKSEIKTDDAIVEDLGNAYQSVKDGASWMADQISYLMPTMPSMPDIDMPDIDIPDVDMPDVLPDSETLTNTVQTVETAAYVASLTS